jgi:hypothetical protein
MGRYTVDNCVTCFLETDAGNILVKILNEFLTVSVLASWLHVAFHYEATPLGDIRAFQLAAYEECDARHRHAT